MARKPEANSTGEIEITPAMIEAGALALASYTNFFETLEEGAERIF